MAKQSSSTKSDPAALAFSAVENALKSSVLSEGDASKYSTKDDIKDTSGKSRQRAAKKIADKSEAIANDMVSKSSLDSRDESSKFLYKLQNKSSSAPIVIATIMSLFWISVTGFIAWLQYGDKLTDFIKLIPFMRTMEFTSLLAIAFLPVLGFFAIAILIRRASDLRIAANSMTEVATRLAQPETHAVDKIATVGQAVRREVNALGDGIERALIRASELEVMVHNEVTSLENTYSDNDTRLRSLIKELSSQRDGVITNSDKVRDAIAQAHTLMIEDLDKAGVTLSEKIITHSKEAQQTFDQATTQIETSFADKSENFISLLDNRSTDLLSSIDLNAERLSLSLDEKLNALNENIENGTIAISQTIDQKSQDLNIAFSQTGSVIAAQLETSAETANSALEAVGNRIVSGIEENTKSSEHAIETISNHLNETLSIKFNTMDSRLNSSIIQIGAAVDNASEKANSTLNNAGEKTLLGISSRVDEVGLILSSRMNEIDSIIGGKGEKIIISLNEHTNSFNENSNLLTLALDEKTSLLNETLNSRTKEFSTSIDNKTNQLASSIDEKTSLLNETLNSRTKEFSTSIDNKTNQLASSIDEKTSFLDKTLNFRAKELSASIDNKTIKLNEALSEQTNQLASSIDEKTSFLDKTLNFRTKELSTSIDSKTIKLNELLSEQTNQLASSIDEQASAVRANTKNAVRSISETMTSKTNEMSEIVVQHIEQVNDNIGKKVDNSLSRLSDVENGLNITIDKAATSIEKSTIKTAEMIEEKVSSARQSIVNMVDDRLGTLPEAITSRADITADRLTALSEDINSSIAQSMSDLEISADKIEETIGTSIASASLTISSDVEQTAARMDITVRTALDQVKEAARHIEDLVEVRAIETAQSLEAKVEEMNKALSSQTNNFAQIISEKSEELNNNLKNHSNILRDALQESSSEAEEIMSSSTSRILSDVNDALKKLNDGNLLLQRVLETSSTNLFELETSVANQTSNYANAVREAVSGTKGAGEMVAQHINALQTTIKSVTSEFGTMLTDLSAETTNINQASSNLDDAGKTTINNLKDRQDAMNELAKSFTLRANEIDERMHSFAQNIATTVNETEERISIAKKAMEGTLNASTINVANRLDKFIDAADQQGQIAKEQLKRTQDELVDEMNAALKDATERFNKTASAMRDTAHQVNNELEATRTELQRGITELPEETRSSASAMRRVVSEQIEALNELNLIVRNQRKTSDISSTNRTGTDRDEYRASKVRQEVQQKPSVENIASITQRIPVQNEPASNSSLAELLRAPTVKKEEAAINIPNVGGNNSDNWLRDVLRNASAKQVESAKPEISMKSLTTKISQAIDENALKEAWERYTSGEVNVFSRRIYTLNGQDTFEQLRKKMSADEHFAKNSSAYIEEFEQLLTKTISSPSSTTSAIDLLTSERGKIFTILAHASGRLK